MALRQMSIARMGEYRPPVQSVGAGGKTGRPKLLHNGTGHGLTGGGGLNAKGTGGGIKAPMHMRKAQRGLRKAKYQSNKFNSLKMADRTRNRDKRAGDQTKGGTEMAPHPIGRFQFGQDQWGFINAKGLVDWTSTAPKSGQPVIGFNQALPWLRSKGAMTKMPTRQTAPMYYQDSIYTRQMADRNNQLAAAKAAHEYQKTNQLTDFQTQTKQLGEQNTANNVEAVAGLGGANIASSGVANRAMGDLARQFQQALSGMTDQNTNEMTRINLDLQNANTGFNTGKAAEVGVAKDRWLAMNPGKKAPQPQRGMWNQGGRNMYTNAQGIPITWTQKPKPKPVVKPKAIVPTR